jgi:hypothetical protein
MRAPSAHRSFDESTQIGRLCKLLGPHSCAHASQVVDLRWLPDMDSNHE